MLDSPVKSPLLNPHGQDFLLLNSPVESPLLSSKSMDPKTSLLDSLCQDLYTGDRLCKLRYFHSWNFYSGPHGLLHMLISTAGRRLLCFLHCCHSIVALLTLCRSAYHYVAAITVLHHVQCPTVQVALYNGT